MEFLIFFFIVVPVALMFLNVIGAVIIVALEGFFSLFRKRDR